MIAGAVTIPIQLRDLNNSPVTGKTLTCTVSKDGAAFGASTNTAAEVGSGDYSLALTADERGTYYTRVKATDGTYTTLVTVTTDAVMRGTDSALLAASYTAPPSDYAKPGDAMTLTSAYDAAKSAAAPGAAMTLTSAYDHAKDNTLAAVQALHDFDPSGDVVAHVTLVDTTTTLTNGTDVAGALTAYGAAKTSDIPTDYATATAVAAIPTTPLLAANYTAPDNAGIAAIQAKTDNLPASPAAVGSAMTLTSAYDAAKTAASAASVTAVPKNVWEYTTRELTDTVADGYTRVTSATYGTLRASSVIDAYASTDTGYATPLVPNVVVAVNGSWAIDLPTGGSYVLVARLAGFSTVTQAVTT